MQQILLAPGKHNKFPYIFIMSGMNLMLPAFKNGMVSVVGLSQNQAKPTIFKSSALSVCVQDESVHVMHRMHFANIYLVTIFYWPVKQWAYTIFYHHFQIQLHLVVAFCWTFHVFLHPFASHHSIFGHFFPINFLVVDFFHSFFFFCFHADS